MPATYVPKRLAQSFPTNTSEATVYTVPGGMTATIKNIVVANVTALPASASISLAPNGSTAGDSNRIMKTVSVNPNQLVTLDLTQVLDTGGFISVKVETASSLVFTISGVELQTITLPEAGLQVAKAGTIISTRPLVNFIEGTNIAITVADNAGAGRADVTVAVTGNLGHVIGDEGTPLATRAGLNFIGAGVSVADNAGANSTDVTIDGGQTDALVFMGGL